MAQTPESHWQDLKRIFQRAVELPPSERAAYLEQACDGNQSLREVVESLLKSHEQTGNFVDTPAFHAAAEMLGESIDIKVGQLVAHYRIVSLLGEGGMGKVYLAHDTTLERKVALKFLPLEMLSNPDRMRRFTQEARTAASLHHPNIAQIFEIDEQDHSRYIAMEYAEGDTLRQLLSRRKIETKRAVELATQIASGLSAAYNSGVIHRDIKPENLVVTPNGQVKILDFGLAKAIENQRDASGER